MSSAGSSPFASDATLLGARRLARDALAVVLEVRLRALREREVLVALGSGPHQLVEVALELGGAVALGARRRLRGALLGAVGGLLVGGGCPGRL